MNGGAESSTPSGLTARDQLARRTRMGAWLGVAPSLTVMSLFMVVPIAIIAVYSFLEANPYGGVRPSFSLEAYVQLAFERDLDDNLVFNDAYLSILLRSVVLAGATTIICLAIGFPVAHYMAMQPPERQNLLIFLVTIPFWTNLLIRTYCWILVLRDTGLVNNALLASGIIEAPLALLYTDGAILLGLVYTYVPFMVLPIYSAVAKLDIRLVEAAHDLYAGRWMAMRKVVVPLAGPGIVAGSILVFVPSIGAFIAPDLLGGGKHLMLGSLIQLQFASSRNWPFGSAVAMVLLSIVLVLLVYYARGPLRRLERRHP